MWPEMAEGVDYYAGTLVPHKELNHENAKERKHDRSKTPTKREGLGFFSLFRVFVLSCFRDSIPCRSNITNE